MAKSIPTHVVLLRSYFVRKVENSALQHMLYVLSFLIKTLHGASANPHGQATTRPAGWHHKFAVFAGEDCENHG
jgi:hypothetical protein